jgi:hypothetical protein
MALKNGEEVRVQEPADSTAFIFTGASLQWVIDVSRPKLVEKKT